MEVTGSRNIDFGDNGGIVVLIRTSGSNRSMKSLRNMSDNLVDKNNIIQCGKDLN
jgi:hypothetical protein